MTPILPTDPQCTTCADLLDACYNATQLPHDAPNRMHIVEAAYRERDLHMTQFHIWHCATAKQKEAQR